jgi:hypothetical protein
MPSFFGSMLLEKFLYDNRDIEYEVSIPGIGSFGLALPLLSFWLQLAMVGTSGEMICQYHKKPALIQLPRFVCFSI